LYEALRRKADEIVASSWNVPGQAEASIVVTQMGPGATAQLQSFYDERLRPFLLDPSQRNSPLTNPIKARAAFPPLRALPGLAGRTHSAIGGAARARVGPRDRVAVLLMLFSRDRRERSVSAPSGRG